jgi:hypothetical protein
LSSAPEEAKFRTRVVPGWAFSKGAFISVKALVRLAAAETRRSPAMTGVDIRTMQSDKIVCNDFKFMRVSFFLIAFFLA